MAGTTTNGLPYPESTDFVTDGAQAIEDLAVDVDAKIGLYMIRSCTATFAGGSNGSVANGVVTVGTNNTSVTVNNAFSAEFSHYKIIYYGGTGSSVQNLMVRIGAADTAYYYSGSFVSFGGGTGNWNGQNKTYWEVVGFMSGSGTFLSMEVFSPYQSVRTSYTAMKPGTGDTGGNAGWNAGYLNNTNSYTGFSITPSGGANMTGGKIYVYGYNI